MEKLYLIQTKKEMIKTKLEEIKVTKEPETQLKIYKEILKINNTDKEIVFKYLLLFKKINEKKMDKSIIKTEFSDYINHFQPKQFNDNFSDIIIKKYSSMEKLNLVIQKILSQDWIKTNYEKRKEALLFFNETINENKKEIKNTSPITWENDELYIYIFFQEFLLQLKRKINYYYYKGIIDYNTIKSEKLQNCIKLINQMENELKRPKISDDSKITLKKLIKKAEENRNSIALVEGNFFKEYLIRFYIFLSEIKDSLLQDFSHFNFDKKENKDIFEYFMLFISNYDFEKIPFYIYSVWKFSFKNLEYNEKLEIKEKYKTKNLPIEFTFEKENKLKVNIKELEKIIEIDNIDDYEFENLIKDINIKRQFNENEFIKYVKIPKINNHIYIKKIIDNWVSFNICIFSSNTIKSLFKTLFKEQNSLILEEKELSIIFKNIFFYDFHTDFKGLTMRQTMRIYEYGPILNLENNDLSKLIYLAFILDINEHEVLGHYNIGYQKYSNETQKYDSPKIEKELSSDYAKKRGYKESGEDIEIKLYGRVIDSLTLKEALFILNLSNYRYDYNDFREEFKKCNRKDIIIDETFEILLKDVFNINSKNIPINENNQYQLAYFNKKYTDEKSYTIKGKHPIDYNIDGIKSENFDEIERRIFILKHLDDDIEFNL